MAKFDWSKDRDRHRLREQGADPLSGDIYLPGRPKQRPGKAALRAEATTAIAKITREVKCAGCGHAAEIMISAAWARRTLRCSVCRSIAE